MNICVFGSSSDLIDKEYLDSAEKLASELVKRGHGIVFGAGKYGVMGATARGASAENGTLIGVSPKFFTEMDVLYDDCTELILTETMRERKGIMEDRADAFIICAGGMGTFEEFFEVLTLKQLRRHEKPIIIYNVKGYYNHMIAMMDNAVKNKFMTDDCKRLYSVADTQEEVFEQLENYVPFSYNKYNFVYEGIRTMADSCEMCAHFVADEEFGDYCSIDLDEDEMERFLTQSVTQCHYFQLYDEYKIVNKQI